MANVKVGLEMLGQENLFVIAGPCVIESLDMCLDIARRMKAACHELGLPYIFKASFDKANRTSISSFRGPGLKEGLEILAVVRDKASVPVLTDIHEPSQAEPAAEVADVLQIPAFLARQTDLVLAAAATGRPLNIKKAQFMAPWDMQAVVEKAVSGGSVGVILSERGSSFGYNTLVVDMRSIPIMRSLGCPVAIDATHGVQKPGGLGTSSGGDREMVPTIAKAAVAAGADGVFLEVHPDPQSARSDAANSLRVDEAPPLLRTLKRIREAAGG